MSTTTTTTTTTTTKMRPMILMLLGLITMLPNDRYVTEAAGHGTPMAGGGSRRMSLTPNSESASFSTEQKRLAEELVVMINQAKAHTLDELKRMVNAFQVSDSSLKTDISMVKTEITNNMKRHLSLILTQISAFYNLFATEWPKDKQFQYNMMRDLLAKVGGLQASLDKNGNFWDAFGKTFDRTTLEHRDAAGKMLGLLDKISRNTDLSNTDVNSVGRQITDISTMLESVGDAIGVIDRRLPGIDSNGDGIMRNLNAFFDAVNLKLDKLITLDLTVAKLSDRVEIAIQKISDSTFPRNDNHLSNGPGGLPLPITRPMEYEL